MPTLAAFRLANWDTPLWVSPNRRDSRYPAADGGVVQYWALHPLACWAEQLRFHDIREPEEVRELLFRPWVATVEVPQGVLEMTFDTAAAHGIGPFALVDDDWTACQHWTATLDVSGLIVPSAALPGTRNLVLFGPRVRARWDVPPLDPATDVPCDPVAGHGVAVEDLLGHVRWRGTLHSGYDAWSRGEPEPLPPTVRVDRRP